VQQERLRALGQMASGIAHDINNAISPVALYTELLLETEPDLSPVSRNYLETIARSIDDVAATVARMREFYRQREPQLMLTPVDLNQLAREVIDLTRARWSDMPLRLGIVIEMRPELAPDIPLIMGVESEVREALTNLVLNAVDALPDGGAVTVRTNPVARDGDSGGAFVAVAVIDTGTGMDEATRRRCMEPFFTTKGERGTGLGLAMAYGVVQRHSAEMEIESTVGEGTTVRVIFAAIHEMPVDVAELGASIEPLAPMRILVIDDDPLLLKSLRDTLEYKGHSVVPAKGGEAGIAAFREAVQLGEPFPIVITDLGMPYVDGRKVASAVKDLAPSTYVILLTGWGQRLVAEGDVPPHVDYVLNKPAKLKDLEEALVHGARFGRA
ncbi:MAG: ATP-binding protein, partial [bacterium]